VIPQLDEGELQAVKSKVESEGFTCTLIPETSQLDAAQAEAQQPLNSWVYMKADDSSVRAAQANAQRNTSSIHTIYTQYLASGNITNAGTGLPPLQKYNSIMDIPAPKAYAEGGYTGNYSGPATVHPHELILNEAQQSNLAGSMNSSRQITLHIDNRGGIITDGSMDTLVAKLQDALKDESYR